MATVTLLDSGTLPWVEPPTAGYGNILTTDSVSPSANSLVLLCFMTQAKNNGVTADSTVSGLGLTWDAITDFDTDPAQESVYGFGVFRAQGTPTPGQITITLTSPDTQRAFLWAVLEVTDVPVGGNGADAIRQSERIQGNSTTTYNLTLASLASSAFFALCGYNRDALGAKDSVDRTDLFSIDMGPQNPPGGGVLGGYLVGAWDIGVNSVQWSHLVAADEPVVLLEILAGGVDFWGWADDFGSGSDGWTVVS